MSARVLVGTWCSLEEVDDRTWPDVLELDWLRAQHPNMGGVSQRPRPGNAWSLALFRDKDTGLPIGVLEAHPLPGYPGVVNVSIFTDRGSTVAGPAMDAFGMYATELFAQGVRLLHHEVLEFNRPVQRIMRGIGVEPSARLREHAYVAGRWWDVLVYSYGAPQWQRALDKFASRSIGRAESPQSTLSEQTPEIP